MLKKFSIELKISILFSFSGVKLLIKLIESKGPNHKPTFKIQVKIKNTKAELGHGSSKKIAEQNAAKKLIDKINNL